MKWPKKKLGEVLDYEQPTKYLVSSRVYEDEFTTPVLTAGKTFILGNTNEKNGIFPKEKLPVIIFDDFTTTTKFVDFPFKVKSSAIKILHAKKDIADTKYLFYLMQTIRFNHKQHKRYWISEYSQLEIPLPPIVEQKRIVEKIEKLFAKIDQAERLRQEASADAAALLPSALQQVFSRQKWPKKKLGEITHSLGGGTPCRSNPDYFKGDIPWITVTDLTDELRVSTISDSRQHITNEAVEKSATNLIPTNSIILTTRVAVGKVGISARPIATNQDCTSFIPHSEIIPEFLAIWFLANRETIKSLSRGIGIMGVRRKDLENLKIPLPPISEQKKIVAYLDSISQKAQELQNLQRQTAADFSALRQSILARAFA